MGRVVVRLPDGPAAIVCIRGRRTHACRYCSKASTHQCDGKRPSGKACNAHLCTDHATHVGTNVDLCPHCQARERAPSQPSLLTGD